MPRRIEADWLGAAPVKQVMDAFHGSGKQAYFVGGCVRDALLDRSGKDIDIATEATPQETIDIAKASGLRFIPTGLEHGTITLVVDGSTFEVTSFRQDVETDGRRAVVAFSTDIRDDARRRDFTMNALYADSSGQVIDPLGGLSDLDAGKVRFIEDADQRISEDYLRILRFFRFYAWYGDPANGLDAEGLAACAAGADGLDGLSRERVGAEITRLLDAPDPSPAVAAMDHSGILNRILPGATSEFLAPLVHLERENRIPPRWTRRLSILGGQDLTDQLRLSKQDSRYLATLKAHLSENTPTSQMGYRDGVQIAVDVCLLRSASLGSPLPSDSFEAAERGSAAQFPVSASDLQPELQGKALGDRLRELEQDWFHSDMTASLSDLLN